MPGPDDVDGIQVPGTDDPVEVGVDEVEPGRRAPVAEQPRLDVGRLERLAQQRVVEQVDLADGQVVGGPPVGVDEGQRIGRERAAPRPPPTGRAALLARLDRSTVLRVAADAPPRAVVLEASAIWVASFGQR